MAAIRVGRVVLSYDAGSYLLLLVTKAVVVAVSHPLLGVTAAAIEVPVCPGVMHHLHLEVKMVFV